MIAEKKTRMYLSLLIIIVLAIVVFLGLIPFINALFGGLILFALFKPLNDYFIIKKKWRPSSSAVTIILLSILIIVIPLSIVLSMVGVEVVDAVQHKAVYNYISTLNEKFPQLALLDKYDEQFPKISQFLVNLVTKAFSQVGTMFINLVIMYFIFFYLLVTPNEVKRRYVYAIVPFNKKHTITLIDQFAAIVKSTLASSGIIAVVQSLLILFSFWLLGIKGPFFWAFIAFIFSFLPALGVFIVWLPVDIFLFFKGETTSAIILLVLGIFMSNIDNVIRPLLQKNSAAKMHPLITLIGVFMGLSLFGIMGLIVGPLLLTFLLLTVQMFKKEYVE